MLFPLYFLILQLYALSVQPFDSFCSPMFISNIHTPLNSCSILKDEALRVRACSGFQSGLLDALQGVLARKSVNFRDLIISKKKFKLNKLVCTEYFKREDYFT